MKITILTLFPEMFDGFLTNSIIKRAIGKKVVEVKIVNIRDYTKDKYGRVDTPPIGGGAGLVMKCQPIVDALKDVSTSSSKKIMLNPRGTKYSQDFARILSKEEDLVLLCGHYEGIDERVNDYVDELVSIGDYVLTGGELGAMVIADSVIRLLDGAITEASLDDESFNDSLLEYPQYTRPEIFEGISVPEVLKSGHHENIEKWRRREAIKTTYMKRPDLLKNAQLTEEEKEFIEKLKK